MNWGGTVLVLRPHQTPKLKYRLPRWPGLIMLQGKSCIIRQVLTPPPRGGRWKPSSDGPRMCRAGLGVGSFN